MPDPRSHRRYKTLRAAYIAAHDPGTPCCLCGQGIDTNLPASTPLGPTVEHRLAVRTIVATARDYAEAVALTCDTSMWGIAHSRCQSQQGARAVNSQVRASSRW